jgi:predicted transcriptional regulator
VAFPLVNCLYCKTEVTKSIKEWNYRHNYYRVKLYACPNCGNQFRVYYHNDAFSHTIPKFVGTKKQILTYLKKHETATEEELAEILKLDIKKINGILLELEKEGIVESPK